MSKKFNAGYDFSTATGLKTGQNLADIIELATFAVGTTALDQSTLEDDGAGAARVKALGVNTVHLADNAVTTSKIPDVNITVAKLVDVLDLSSKTVTLPALSVVEGMIADDAVTRAKIADAAMSGADATLVTGTKGTANNLVKWDANGDAIDSGITVVDNNDLSVSPNDAGTRGSIKAYADSLVVDTFESTATDIPATDTDVEVAHGLGATPLLFSVCLRCISTDLGYAENDEVNVNGLISVSTVNQSAWANATNIGFRFGGTSIQMCPRNSAASAGNIDTAKWKLIFRARK